MADSGKFHCVFEQLGSFFFHFFSIISAFDLYRSWQQNTKRHFPRHYGSSSDRRQVVASSATTQLDNRRRFALRLTSLPKGDQARGLIGAADSALGQRLQSYLGCWNGREETVLLEVASPLDATTTIEEAEAAANEVKRTDRPGLTIFTDGSRLENGATGYAVVWKNGQTWKGHKTHMGWGQEAYDAE